tara:strand:+ start:2853 stop:3272 length:420 start_codon:yes stop_codon:yes gene_type:complete
MIETKINNTVNFINAQLELYKIEFAETSDNKYLEVMNKMNDTLKLIKDLTNAYKGTCTELMKTKRELEESLRLSNINNDSRYFTIKGVKYELTGNVTTPGGKLMHHIKNTVTNDYKRDDEGNVIPVSDVDLKKILDNIK